MSDEAKEGPFIIFPGMGQQPPPMPDPLMNDQRMSLEHSNAYHNARIRNSFAGARGPELRVILDSMKEIRTAINDITVKHGDNGSGERPAIMPSFDETVREKLQNAYLRMAERCVNYSELMCNHLGVQMTNEYKEKPKPDEPCQPPTARKPRK